MPNYKGHLIGGTVAFFGVLHFILLNQSSSFLYLKWFLLTLLGALFPDIDTKSKGQKIFYSMLLILFVFLLYKKQFSTLIIMSFLACIPLIVNHRGIFHKLWFILGLSFIMLVLSKVFYPHNNLIFWDILFFTLGAVSHIWLDVGFKKMIRLR